MLSRLLKALSSLRLTVVLVALSIVLVFLGTVAQEPMGLYLVQERFFKAFFVDHIALNAAIRKASHLVFVNLDPLPPEAYELHPRIPVFPGGYLLGGLLLANLLAAHATKLRVSWGKAGILATHAGIVLMIVGQVFTDMMSQESHMDFREGQTVGHSEDFSAYELAFTKPVAGTDRDLAVLVPASMLKAGATIRNDRLPFSVTVRRYHENADVRRRAPMVDTNVEPASTKGAGARMVIEPQPPVRDSDHKNIPAAVIELAGASGTLGTWMVSGGIVTQDVEAGGEGWRVELRPVRYELPFTLTLLKTTHEVYQGTDLPRNFQSRVRIDNAAAGEHREVDIYMNNPLRYGGLTFYQFQMGRERLEAGGAGTSTLQVVRNPSWVTPYVSTALVFGGMLLHFLIKLAAFIAASARRDGARPATGAPPAAGARPAGGAA